MKIYEIYYTLYIQHNMQTHYSKHYIQYFLTLYNTLTLYTFNMYIYLIKNMLYVCLFMLVILTSLKPIYVFC
jgi:hypothetical protein